MYSRWNRGRRRHAALGLVYLIVLTPLWGFAAPARAAVTFGQIDNFEDGTTMGWHQGANPNSPTNVATGGPRGEGDHFLQNVSIGGERLGGKLVMLNDAQWSGDFAGAGVTQIDASVANLGDTPLYLRVAVQSGISSYASTGAIELPAGSGWRRVTFGLTPDAMSKVEGLLTLTDALTQVNDIRILSVRDAPNYRGDPLVGALGVDDLRALRLPGDANFDGRVDAADLLTVRRNLSARGPQTWAQGDFDFDGRVTARDLLLLRRSFGTSIPTGPAAAASVRLALLPEPGTVSLVGFIGTGLLLRRRTRHL